jgi:hypothetical protein
MDRYLGNWDRNVANGKGVEDFPGVGKYAGCFEGDLRHGVGVIECGPLKYCESIAEILVMNHFGCVFGALSAALH